MECPFCNRIITVLHNPNKCEYYCFVCSSTFITKITNTNDYTKKLTYFEFILLQLCFDIYDLNFISKSTKIIKSFYSVNNGFGLTANERNYILAVFKAYIIFLSNNRVELKRINYFQILSFIINNFNLNKKFPKVNYNNLPHSTEFIRWWWSRRK